MIIWAVSKRILHSLLVLLGLSLLIFIIARIMPGDPARLALGPLATAEQVESYSKEMQLDKPILMQYWYWLKGAVRGDFGKSVMTKRPISVDIAKFLPATLELVIFSFVFVFIIGQGMGLLAGKYQNTWFDNVTRVLSYFGIVTPAFVFAVLFLLVTYALGFSPPVGRISLQGVALPPTRTGFLLVDSLIAGNLRTFVNALQHLLLPAISLAMAPLAQEARITRASLIDNSQKDFVAAHRVFRIPESQIMMKYLLKPSLIPTVSIMGLDLACLLTNAFLVESVFMWPGFSRYGISAMLNKDLNAVVAVILILGVAFVVANIVIDAVLLMLDPRNRQGKETSR